MDILDGVSFVGAVSHPRLLASPVLFLGSELESLNKKQTYPTDPFSISEPQNQEIAEFYLVQERRKTDFEAPKLWKDRSGTQNIYTTAFFICVVCYVHFRTGLVPFSPARRYLCSHDYGLKGDESDKSFDKRPRGTCTRWIYVALPPMIWYPMTPMLVGVRMYAVK